ncbi:hypothetical protein FZ934_20180 (plasmid) [Rhizobium grahamii]|uniref:Uncharacterized protein n=1 Tax=Rhizobium grahamii TaxID=1120045 RepID=A0A5Q0CF06_9HYPH|nr:MULTISPECIES: hypothetical protein [Rhizobium]QFY62700.1 hypothetical protein FZ934_20180 [Rhizobium grahamii]QRM52556.1 hypothetical protein F3Y33_25480 [Rhizobium sp. BG6]
MSQNENPCALFTPSSSRNRQNGQTIDAALAQQRGKEARRTAPATHQGAVQESARHPPSRMLARGPPVSAMADRSEESGDRNNVYEVWLCMEKRFLMIYESEVASLLDKTRGVEALLCTGQHTTQTIRVAQQNATNHVFSLMVVFARKALEAGLGVQEAYEEFEELLDEMNEGVEQFERLYLPKFSTFKSAMIGRPRKHN